jgi:hypothetical protein
MFASSGHIQSPKMSHCSSTLFTPLPLLHITFVIQKNEGGQQVVGRKKIVI